MARVSVRVALTLAVGLVLGAAKASDRFHGPENYGPADVVPLEDVLERVRRSFEGHVLKVELECEKCEERKKRDKRETRERGGAWIYEIKVLTPGGNVLKLEYDAYTAELLDVEGQRVYSDDDDED